MSFSIAGFFTKILAGLMAMLYLIGAPFAVKDKEPDVAPEDSLLTLNIVSDIHVETNNFYRKDVYVQELRNMEKYYNADALIMLGDNVMNGQLPEYLILNGLTDALSPADKRIMVCGNHDTGNMSGVFDKTYERYLHFHNTFSDVGEIDKGYFSTEINGYTFISLFSEDDSDDCPTISLAQYNFLKDTLDEKAVDGKPVFVLCHYPASWGDVTDNSSLNVRELIKQYDNIFYFYGHIHPSSVVTTKYTDSVYGFMLPRITECDEDTGETYDETGLGLRVYVTEDEVIVKTVNYYTAEEVAEQVISLVK